MKTFFVIVNPYPFEILDLSPELYTNDQLIIIASYQQQQTYPKEISRVYYSNNFSKSSLLELIDTYFDLKKYSYDFIPFSEETVPVCGYLNSYANSSGLDSKSINFTDKFYMRKKINDALNQPLFYKVDSIDDIYDILSQSKNKYILKPRVSSSSNNIHIIKKEEDIIKSIDYTNFIMEEMIDYDIMFTTDGVYSKGELIDFNIHRYTKKMLDSIDENSFQMVVSTLHDLDPKIFDRLNNLTQQVLDCLSDKNFIFPFHIEWFYSFKDDKITFCEGAARFGGALITDLIYLSQNKNVKEIFWNEIFSHKNKQNSTYSVPKIACTFLGYRKQGTLIKSPSNTLQEYDWIYNAYNFVKKGSYYSKSQNAVENTIVCSFQSENLEDYNSKRDALISYQKKFIFK